MDNIEVTVKMFQAKIDIINFAPAIWRHVRRLHRNKINGNGAAMWKIKRCLHYPTPAATAQIQDRLLFPRDIIRHDLRKWWDIFAHDFNEHVVLKVETIQLFSIGGQPVYFRVVVEATSKFLFVRLGA